MKRRHRPRLRVRKHRDLGASAPKEQHVGMNEVGQQIEIGNDSLKPGATALLKGR